MLFNLLEETAQTGNKTNNWLSWVLIGVLVVVMVGAMFVMNKKSKKRQQEADELINAVKPGNKVKTIGGVCGIVVEVDKEENTFVLETGSETSGKCYMKFDRQAILQSDAVVEKTTAKPEQSEEKAVEEKAEEEPFANQAEQTEAPIEMPTAQFPTDINSDKTDL